MHCYVLLILYVIFIKYVEYSILFFFIFLESFRPPKFLDGSDKNGFNLGCCRNIQEVFGKEVLLWPFPIDTR